jgi:hypothetical protein
MRALLVYRRFASTPVYLPSILSRAGILCDVITHARHPVRRSRAIAHTYVCESSDEAFFQAICARVREERYDGLLLIDEPARSLVYARETPPELEPYLPIPRSNELHRAAADKQLFQSWCERRGVPTPATRVVNSLGEIEAFVSERDYPVVLKGAQGFGGEAVKIVHTPEQARSAFARLSVQGAVLVQEFIHGPVGSTAFVAHRGRITAWFASEKYIALSGGLGPSAVRRFQSHPELGRIARHIAEAGEISGITGFDWMDAGDGRFVVVDPHFGRCTSPAVLGDAVGIQLGKAWVDAIAGSGSVQEPRASRELAALFPQCLDLVFQGRLWELLRRATPLTSGVSYYFGPRDEWRMSLALARDYLHAGVRVLVGHAREMIWSKGARDELAVGDRRSVKIPKPRLGI